MDYVEYHSKAESRLSDIICESLRGLPRWLADAIYDTIDMECVATNVELSYLKRMRITQTGDSHLEGAYNELSEL